MLPANADEADIAARAVAHAAYGQHCLRLARRFCDTDQAWFMKCCAMSNATRGRCSHAFRPNAASVRRTCTRPTVPLGPSTVRWG